MTNPNREDYSIPKEGWSDWVRAIVPDERAEDETEYTQRNETHRGYYCNTIKTVFDDKNCAKHDNDDEDNDFQIIMMTMMIIVMMVIVLVVTVQVIDYDC